MKQFYPKIWRRDPWSDQKKPPELDKLVSDFFNKLKQTITGKKSSSTSNPTGLWLLLLGVIVLTWAGLGFFIVKPAEEAVILRFGQYVETVTPGPHWVPMGIESYTKVNVQQVNSFTFGADYLTQSSDDGDQRSRHSDSSNNATSSEVGDDTDKNVVYAELSVQYRVIDPRHYLFNIVNGPATLEQAAAAALSEVVGTMRLNAVLTVGRDQLTWEVKKRLQTMMDAYEAGIDVVAVNVRKIQAPEEVADAFLDVVQAGQDEQRYIQQAQAYARKVVPIAEGNRNRILAEAQAYQEQVILNAQADVASYMALLRVYQQAPTITRDRMYLEMMQSVLSSTSKVLIDSDKQTNNWINLPLDRLSHSPKKI
ncbi:MAG: FtsH protease activity modulator HflK [Gammaproteobacteria bacterium]|nr:FtsH protease activity modulator HflK [Gammaproteobacteria bacterium]MCD8543148.1 FtsH protease activity modulator HflK [Gammaproteobacteria bacterium]